MKRIIALLLALTMILAGCTQPKVENPTTEPTDEDTSCPAV